MKIAMLTEKQFDTSEAEKKKEQERQEILAELDAIDRKSIRAMRGDSAEDKTKLAELDAQAVILRGRL